MFDFGQCFSILDKGRCGDEVVDCAVFWDAIWCDAEETGQSNNGTTECPDEPDWAGGVRKTAIGVLPRRAKEACMFKRILKILPAVCLATGMAWAADSPFIGEWKLDLSLIHIWTVMASNKPPNSAQTTSKRNSRKARFDQC